MGIENLPMHSLHSLEDDAEREGNFRYELFDLYEAANALEDVELREITLSMCDELRQQSVEYLGYVTRFMEGSHNEQVDFARRLSHNAIISNLTIITRTLGGDFVKWYNDPAMHGGLGGEKGRERIKSWALHEGLHILKVQQEREERNYEDLEAEGSTASAA